MKDRKKRSQKTQENKIIEEEEFLRKFCTFSPSKNKNPTRDQNRVVKDLYEWKCKKDENLRKNKEFLNSEERLKFTEKPKIDQNSKKIAGKVSII